MNKCFAIKKNNRNSCRVPFDVLIDDYVGGNRINAKINISATMSTRSSTHLNTVHLDNSLTNDGLNGFTQHESNNDDYPNEMCSSMSSSTEQSTYFNNLQSSYVDTPNQSDLSDQDRLLESWKMNYHEAAIYLQEGLNNDKFDCHPKNKEAIPLYLLVHSTYFYVLDLFASLLLLFLVLCEEPAIKAFEIPIYIHALLELFALSIIAIELYLKFKWMGAKHFFNHTRTTIKLVTLIVMIIESIVIMIRLDSHFRITRALRPVFLIDNFYCGGIRRFIRQMIQSMPPILDMLILLFFFLLASALFAFYLFAGNPNDPYFKTFTKSFINLFVLITTANFPDIMMPSYYKSRSSSIFFIIFLVISLYLLMNIMLAVVYEIFTRMEKDKFRKLMLHRRLACQHAFRLLVPKSSPDRMSYRHFFGMLNYYSPQLSKLDKYLMFKTLDTQNNGKITLNQFYHFYEFVDLKWTKNEISTPFYMQFNFKFILDAGNLISKIVKSHYFDIYVYVTIILAVLWQLIETNFPNKIFIVSGIDRIIHLEMTTISLIFIILFTIELLMKIIAFDLAMFLKDNWNMFDFVVVTASIVGLIFSIFNLSFAFIYVLRSARLLKLFQLKRSYRNILDSFLLILIKRLSSAILVVLIVLYSFAILGMELFSEFDLRDCCEGTEFASYFRTGKNGTDNGYYYLNNFEDVLTSYVTLFQLMVANDWQVIMEGYSHLYSPWCRAYFMFYYLVTMIMITIVIAFVLEAFLFRIQYKTKLGGIEQDTKVIVDVNLNQNEYEYCMLAERLCDQSEERWRYMHNFIDGNGELPRNSIETIHCFHGEKLRTKFLFSLKMYAEEVANWVKEFDLEEEQKRREMDLRLIRVSKRCMSC